MRLMQAGVSAFIASGDLIVGNQISSRRFELLSAVTHALI